MTKDTEHNKRKYVVIAADDLGRSPSVNTAIIESHKNGILTSASLMAGGQAFEEAVKIAVECNSLSVGLHVTLCDGRAVLPPSEIPNLVDHEGNFEKSPAKAWVSYMRSGVLSQIDAEVEAQFDRIEGAGIHSTHVDGHHHLQMNPIIFEIICKHASKRRIGWIRLPSEPLSVVLSSRSFSRGLMPLVEWLVFGMLKIYNLKIAMKYDMNVVCNSLGLSWTGSINEKSFLDLLDSAAGPFNEIFTHPDVSTDSGRRELEALTSKKMRDKLSFLGIELIGYRELSKEGKVFDSAWERYER